MRHRAQAPDRGADASRRDGASGNNPNPNPNPNPKPNPNQAMAALRVPTTRCLCVVATGDGVVRQWYGEDGRERVLNEPGAVGTRVARSYLRFGQMELFTQRGELPLLQAR